MVTVGGENGNHPLAGVATGDAPTGCRSMSSHPLNRPTAQRWWLAASAGSAVGVVRPGTANGPQMGQNRAW